MKCDLCENEATVREVTVRNGVRIERHLCEACAAQHGIEAHGAGALVDLFSKLNQPQPAKPPAPPKAPAPTISVAPPGHQQLRMSFCAVCKLTFAEFKQHGQLGCQHCYAAFEGQLGSLIERAHEGAVAHVGKSPRRIATGAPATPPTQPGLSSEERLQRLQALQRQLDQAIKSEQYEIAAKVRDEIKKLGGDRP